MMLRTLMATTALIAGIAAAGAQTQPNPGQPGVPQPPAAATPATPPTQSPSPTQASPAPSAPPVTTQATPTGADVFYKDSGLTTWRASESMGAAVYNSRDERIGEIDELLVDETGKVQAAVIGVGGFLGLGEKNVAVNYSAFRMTRDNNGRTRLMLDIPRTSLEAAPEYRLVRSTRG